MTLRDLGQLLPQTSFFRNLGFAACSAAEHRGRSANCSQSIVLAETKVQLVQESGEALSPHKNRISCNSKTKTQQSEEVRHHEHEELFMKAHMQTKPSRRR